eukprot:10647421-Lingulodinium_polyedra.AAC.1
MQQPSLRSWARVKERLGLATDDEAVACSRKIGPSEALRELYVHQGGPAADPGANRPDAPRTLAGTGTPRPYLNTTM